MDISSIFFYVLLVIQIVSYVLTFYYFFTSFFCWIPKREIEDVSDKEHTYALIVAAHNEETVIAQMIRSLKQLDYNHEKYEIFVIADNCTDNTAEVARREGAQVFERFHDTLKGKGHALEWMFENIYAMEREFDNICIFDADNVVSKNFLKEINKIHNKGFRVVQGNIESKNPYDSWITMAYSISFWMTGKIFQQARYNIGISCQLCGTGFSVSVPLLRELGWGATCLTEDMEFTAKLVMNNEKVGWAHTAYVYDEKPLTLAQSWRQRKRWMQGHADVCSRFAARLLKKAIKENDISALDCAIYVINPLKILALGVITAMGLVNMLFPNSIIATWTLYYQIDAPVFWTLFSAFTMLYTPFVVTYEKRTINRKLIISYFLFGLYSLTWIPITIQGLIDKNKTEWSHTEHVRNIDIAEVEQ